MKYGDIVEWREEDDPLGSGGWVMTMFYLGENEAGEGIWITLADTDPEPEQAWDPGFMVTGDSGDYSTTVVVIEEAK